MLYLWSQNFKFLLSVDENLMGRVASETKTLQPHVLKNTDVQ
jgi:hypothetical protein